MRYELCGEHALDGDKWFWVQNWRSLFPLFVLWVGKERRSPKQTFYAPSFPTCAQKWPVGVFGPVNKSEEFIIKLVFLCIDARAFWKSCPDDKLHLTQLFFRTEIFAFVRSINYHFLGSSLEGSFQPYHPRLPTTCRLAAMRRKRLDEILAWLTELRHSTFEFAFHWRTRHQLPVSPMWALNASVDHTAWESTHWRSRNSKANEAWEYVSSQNVNQLRQYLTVNRCKSRAPYQWGQRG